MANRNRRKIKINNYHKKEKNENQKGYLSKIMSREIKWIIFSIFLVLMLMISTAYAIFSTTVKSEK